MNDLRMSCGSYGFKSPVQRWNDGDNIWGAFVHLERVNTEKNITRGTYTMAFRLGTYIATQFKPIVAKTIYEMCGAKTVLDTSVGWGDRLTVSMHLMRLTILVVTQIQIPLQISVR